ncbi:dTDP-4-dehydrorhamnose reductase [Paenibacillus sp. UNCCL117]|uniref:dTDP-4-dehydrorhamnose reductase family protein n=1 Tax=unclassified Paenibacillus TaxID=185978 RepID=UPI00087F4639|nr:MULTISPECIES: SDR family oxidoreductase [unclassified Paenibacillus]SDD30177.1 dTDP-4-dehydrorhamnose reductase [Paenibacillus sp. cl123]SFW40395.1 dTDP-4-dehydrorhamnose reductase [Paenibacillus sp. UNCCL117]
MKLLILGGNGMAGHLLLRYLDEAGEHELFYTIRTEAEKEGLHRTALPGARLYVDVADWERVSHAIELIRPDVIVNCVGILNDAARLQQVLAYEVNGLLPHKLARQAESVGARLIHISTDCVFNGDRGRYEERHVPDGHSVYARTKALGEVNSAPHLTIRTSIIGPELRQGGIGLLHWFLQQSGEIKGFVHVPWNGVTTLELAKFIRYALERGSGLSGLVHLTAPETVSKYELLKLFQRTFGRSDVTIRADDAIVLDRTLQSTRADLGYAVPDYETMLAELSSWMRMHP